MSVPSDVSDVDTIIKRFGAAIAQAYVHRGVVQLSELDKRLVDHQVEKNADMSRTFPVGSWVTITNGLYVGDVGKVYHSTMSSDEIQLLVAPRLPEGPSEYYRMSHKGCARTRPSPTLCILDNVPDGDIEPGPVVGSFRVGDEVFLTSGLKIMTVQGLHYARPQPRPSASDVWLFTLAGCDTVLETNRSFLRVGDLVEVIRGGACGEMGPVERVDGESVEIEGVEDRPTCANLSDVKRVFQPGNAVVVKLGHYKGCSGLVCGVQDTKVSGIQYTEITIVLGESRELVRYTFKIKIIHD